MSPRVGFRDLFRRRQERAVYARTNADLLVNDPDGFPSAQAPMWWLGYDSGGGAYPIGPNGPWSETGPARSVVIRATALITGPLTTAPFRVIDEGGPDDGGVPALAPRWLTDPMLTRPDDRFGSLMPQPAVGRLARSLFWTEWIRSAIWWGLGGFLCVEDAAGMPVPGTCRLVHPGTIATERGPDNVLCWTIGERRDWDTLRFDRDGRVNIGGTVYRLVVLRNPHSPIDAEGMSKGVFELSPSAFRLSRQLAAYEAGQFRSGVPNGYLKVHQPDLTQLEADQIREKWLDHHGGDRRSIGVLNAVTDFTALNLSPVDAELAEVKRLNIADVAYAFGLDPMTLGAAVNSSGTYTNLRDSWQNHRDFGLAPWIAAVQDTLSAFLAGSNAVRVSLDQFANPEPGDRYAAYQTALAAGILTLDEVRAAEGLPPLRPPDDANNDSDDDTGPDDRGQENTA